MNKKLPGQVKINIGELGYDPKNGSQIKDFTDYDFINGYLSKQYHCTVYRYDVYDFDEVDKILDIRNIGWDIPNNFNGYTKKELIKLLYAYDNYIQEWYMMHDEGCPACLAEFIDNEYEEDEE